MTKKSTSAASAGDLFSHIGTFIGSIFAKPATADHPDAPAPVVAASDALENVKNAALQALAAEEEKLDAEAKAMFHNIVANRLGPLAILGAPVESTVDNVLDSLLARVEALEHVNGMHRTSDTTSTKS